MRILVTGGAGFIGSNLVRYLLRETPHEVFNLDKLTYAGNLASLADVAEHPRYHFRQVCIVDRPALEAVFAEFAPEAVMHLAAESHVDRSIDGPTDFVLTNVVGTATLLEVSRGHLKRAPDTIASNFRFLHTSTDEVFGTLEAEDPPFNETTAYAPRSPYAASKAASDHLVRAWAETYQFPILLTNCSNNYGPFQFPEKLLPTVILQASRGETIPVYGQGTNIRDWLHVEDHVRGLVAVLEQGRLGESYVLGANCEQRNIDLVETVCEILDTMAPSPKFGPHRSLIRFVADRPGHDFRYATDASKARQELNWAPSITLREGLQRTVEWYLRREDWWRPLLDRNVGALTRLGTSAQPSRP